MKRIEEFDITYALGVLFGIKTSVDGALRDCYSVYNDPEALEKVNRIYSILKELEEYLQEQELN